MTAFSYDWIAACLQTRCFESSYLITPKVNKLELSNIFLAAFSDVCNCRLNGEDRTIDGCRVSWLAVTSFVRARTRRQMVWAVLVNLLPFCMTRNMSTSRPSAQTRQLSIHHPLSTRDKRISCCINVASSSIMNVMVISHLCLRRSQLCNSFSLVFVRDVLNCGLYQLRKGNTESWITHSLVGPSV